MKNKQTYKEAVLKTVMWWSEAIQKPLNQNNGDNSPNGGMAFMLMNLVASNAQESISPDKIKTFEESLTKRLMLIVDRNRAQWLDVDYGPNQILRESAEEAKIDTSVFPCKTWTRIGKENEVEVSMGYGTVPSII